MDNNLIKDLKNDCVYSAQEIAEGLEKILQRLNGSQTSGENVNPNQKTDLEIFEPNSEKKEKD